MASDPRVPDATPPATFVDGGKFVRVHRSNIKSDYIEITEDKLENILLKHFALLGNRSYGLALLSVVLTVFLTLLTASFEEDFGLSAPTWEAFFLLVGAGALLWLVTISVRIVYHRKKSSLSFLITTIKNAHEDPKREALTPETEARSNTPPSEPIPEPPPATETEGHDISDQHIPAIENVWGGWRTAGTKKRLFISFDIESDRDLKTTLVSQLKAGVYDNLIDISHSSAGGPSVKGWSNTTAATIRECDAVAVICGENTHNTVGLNAEVVFAQQEGVRYFLLWGRSGRAAKKPRTAKQADKRYNWTRQNLRGLIAKYR